MGGVFGGLAGVMLLVFGVLWFMCVGDSSFCFSFAVIFFLQKTAEEVGHDF